MAAISTTAKQKDMILLVGNIVAMKILELKQILSAVLNARWGWRRGDLGRRW
jgi:hypothetical protein